MGGFTWPGDHRAALALTFDVDAGSAIVAVDPKYARRLTTMSHQDYGPRVGVPRILRMLERNGVTGSFFVPGLTADRHPGTVEAIVAAGHDLGHHGYSHVPYHDLSDDGRRADVERAVASLERITGRRPEGFRAPWWELTDSTPALLAEYGFRWDSSMMDDDRPYLLDTGRGILAELPVHWMLDDWEQYAFLPEPNVGSVIESPAKVLDLWTGELDALAAEGGLMILTSHPFLSGRASRVATLERVVEHARAAGGIWIAPLSEIAAHTRSVIPDTDARPVPSVHIEEGIYERR
ncbi:MAG TPA: polysaccharide deacetylase [Gaiellales bacterium]|jgi:peptidoglycan/xylan/chitin deacetylase (PgdA/CDA1 family)|nr:polysaccharide deacetylase [Gaiellales bacterium]